MFRAILIFAVALLLVINSYAQDFKITIVQPKNISGDSQIDWLSNTFSKSIQLEMRKEKLKADITDELPESINRNDFLILSSYSKVGERIMFHMNIIRKGDAPIKNKEDVGIIESFTIAFIPDVIYETKTYISRIARLYIASLVKIPSTKFNPISYKFPPDRIVGLSNLVAKIPVKPGSLSYDRIIFEPSDSEGWLAAGIENIRKGEISEGISFISRYISRIAPTFSTEEELINDENIRKLIGVLKIALPGDSKEREEAIKSFIISQFYGDFSDNEIKNLYDAINKDKFLWLAMKKLGDIHFARGDYRTSLTYYRDYMSTSNEGLGFIMVLSRSISLVEELSRGY